MAFAVVGIVALLGVVAWIVWLLRPEIFKCNITLAKLASFDLEMRSPRKPDSIDPGPPG